MDTIPKNWFIDYYSKTCGLIFKHKGILFHHKSKYQDIKIIDSLDYGKILLLDDFIYRSEWFGNIIPEMIVHTSVLAGKKKKNVLLIGGGDGWSLAELIKYPEITKIDLIEIDRNVIEACRNYFSNVNRAFDDKRVSVFYEDGNDFIDKTTELYDLILVTPSSPFSADGSKSAAYKIFQKEYFRKCKEKLSPDGVFLTDGTNVFYSLKDIAYQSFTHKTVLTDLKSLFKYAKLFYTTSPLIPGGLFTLAIASDKFQPDKDVRKKPSKVTTQYYNSEYHTSAFVLPGVI
jgi:spermidine synthase